MAEELNHNQFEDNLKAYLMKKLLRGKIKLIMGEPHIDPGTLAEQLGLQRSTLSVWRVQKKGPSYKKIGHNIFYSIADTEKWIADHCNHVCFETDQSE